MKPQNKKSFPSKPHISWHNWLRQSKPTSHSTAKTSSNHNSIRRTGRKRSSSSHRGWSGHQTSSWYRHGLQQSHVRIADLWGRTSRHHFHYWGVRGNEPVRRWNCTFDALYQDGLTQTREERLQSLSSFLFIISRPCRFLYSLHKFGRSKLCISPNF